MATTETVASAAAQQPSEPVKLREMLFKFKLENGEKPELSENSQILVVVNSVITELDIRKLFKDEKITLDIDDADIKGHSALEFLDVKKSEIGLEVEGVEKNFKLSFYDVLSKQIFKIEEISRPFLYDFNKEASEGEINEFAKLIIEAKKIQTKDLNEKQEEVQILEIKDVAQNIKEEGNTDDQESFDDVKQALIKVSGYKEFKTGRLRLFVPFLDEDHDDYAVEDFDKLTPHELIQRFTDGDQPEYLFKMVDDEEKDFRQLVTKSRVEDAQKPELIFDFTDRDDDGNESQYHLICNGKSMKIKEGKWVKPVPAPIQEEEVPEPTKTPVASTEPEVPAPVQEKPVEEPVVPSASIDAPPAEEPKSENAEGAPPVTPPEGEGDKPAGDGDNTSTSTTEGDTPAEGDKK